MPWNQIHRITTYSPTAGSLSRVKEIGERGDRQILSRNTRFKQMEQLRLQTGKRQFFGNRARQQRLQSLQYRGSVNYRFFNHVQRRREGWNQQGEMALPAHVTRLSEEKSPAEKSKVVQNRSLH